MPKPHGNKVLNVGELIEKLKEFPSDATVIFYDIQYEHVSWNITHVESNALGRVVMSDQNFM